MSLYFLSGTEMGKAKTKKTTKKVAKVALGPSRIAFLAIVEINLAGIAKKLAKGYQKNPDKIKNFWAKFGGDWKKLAAAISKGSKQKIGVAPAAAAAAATPIIVVLIPLLKDLLKGTPEGDVRELSDTAEQGKKDLENNPNIEKSDAKTDEDFKAGLIKKDGKEGSAGIIGGSMLAASLPLYLSIPFSLFVVHWYFSHYAPMKIKTTYKNVIGSAYDYIKKTITRINFKTTI
jgi:hypothetical protein